MVGSLSNGSSGPSPKISSRISRDKAFPFGKAERNHLAVDGVTDNDQHFFAGGVAGVLPSFSRSRRSRILRCRSAFTCW